MVVKFGVKFNQTSPDTVPEWEEKSLIGKELYMPQKIINLQKRPFELEMYLNRGVCREDQVNLIVTNDS